MDKITVSAHEMLSRLIRADFSAKKPKVAAIETHVHEGTPASLKKYIRQHLAQQKEKGNALKYVAHQHETKDHSMMFVVVWMALKSKTLSSTASMHSKS